MVGVDAVHDVGLRVEVGLVGHAWEMRVGSEFGAE